jgi:RNA polymerase sigma-70 factor (ECF subfamily)
VSTHETFRQQVSDHIPALRLYARSLRRHRDQADDLEQDCIERALSRSHLYNEGTNLRGWLFTIMRNLAITQMRREAFRQRTVSYYGARWLNTVEASQDVLVELKESIELTKMLTTFERRVVEHMCFDDLSYDETARRTGNPIGTIKSRLSRARRRLRDAVISPELDGARSGALAARPTVDHSSAGMQSTE